MTARMVAPFFLEGERRPAEDAHFAVHLNALTDALLLPGTVVNGR